MDALIDALENVRVKEADYLLSKILQIDSHPKDSPGKLKLNLEDWILKAATRRGGLRSTGLQATGQDNRVRLKLYKLDSLKYT